jgi:ribonuclease HepT-like protein
LNQRLYQLAVRIRQELSEIDYTLKRATEGLEKARQNNDDLYLDGIALNLHSFYSGIERLLERIAVQVDGHLPQGANWHQALLLQMADEVPQIRPAVLSEKIQQLLDEYRGFRHIVRNFYSYKFDPARLERLTRNAPALHAHLKEELCAFADFLETIVKDNG